MEIIHTFLHERFGAGAVRQLCTECAPLDLGARADYLFIRNNRRVIHAVKARSTLSEAFDVVAFSQAHPANYWWLAVPAEAFDPEARAIRDASSAGIGVLLVRGPGKLVVSDGGSLIVREGPPPSVQIKMRAIYDRGNFMDVWPGLADRWYGRAGPPKTLPEGRQADTAALATH